MTLNFVMIVDDAGELKSVQSSELPEDLQQAIDVALNKILDDRAIAAGEYDPSDNDTPFIVGLFSDFETED